jgi:hypothetical protein
MIMITDDSRIIVGVMPGPVILTRTARESGFEGKK